MTRLHNQISIYISCLLVAVGMHVLMHGLPYSDSGLKFGVLAAIGALLFFGAFGFHKSGFRPGEIKWLELAVLLIGTYCVVFPVIWPNATAGTGMARAVEATRLWPQVFVCVFAGLVLAKKDRLNGFQDGALAATSIAPYIYFGLALTFGFYALLIHAGSQGDSGRANWFVRAFLANSPIHYLIVTVFFVIASYIADATLRLRFGTPLTGAIRKFIRMLIGTLPLLGFLGTVAGIMDALSGLPLLFSGGDTVASDLTPALTKSLGGISLAFETTLLGLVASLIATLALGYVEKAEADAVVRVAAEPGILDG